MQCTVCIVLHGTVLQPNILNKLPLLKAVNYNLQLTVHGGIATPS